jgi:HSP20 family protein
MSTAIQTPIQELESLRSQFDTLVSDLWSAPRIAAQAERITLDLKETDSTFIATASLPGFTPEEITVEITGGGVSIRAEHTVEQEERKSTWHLRERRAGTAWRTFTLPIAVRQDDARATLQEGVLTVTIPKMTPTPSLQVPIQQPSASSTGS